MGVAYSIFETGIGRCGIVWTGLGVLAVQLPEAREIDMRRNLLRQHLHARETSQPPRDIEAAIDGIAAVLRGQPADLSEVLLDMTGVPAFSRRVYEAVRAIPYGEMRTQAEIATQLGASGALYAVSQALSRNPYTLLVPCHRARPSAGDTSGRSLNGGAVSHYRLLSIEGALARGGPTLFDVLLPVARPPLPT